MNVGWAALLMAAIAVAVVVLDMVLVTDLERLTQRTETALRSPATDAQALRGLSASALDGAQGMTRAASAALLIAIGACALSGLVLYAACRALRERERGPD